VPEPVCVPVPAYFNLFRKSPLEGEINDAPNGALAEKNKIMPGTGTHTGTGTTLRNVFGHHGSASLHPVFEIENMRPFVPVPVCVPEPG
jgi:hypothetical protein